MQKIKRYFPSVCWGTALLLLYFFTPSDDGFSLCVLSQLGFTHCPGCGIGHAIHYALHFNITASWDAHFLGMPATIGLLYLTIQPFIIHHRKTTFV
jgi:hypothetical protein